MSSGITYNHNRDSCRDLKAYATKSPRAKSEGPDYSMEKRMTPLCGKRYLQKKKKGISKNGRKHSVKKKPIKTKSHLFVQHGAYPASQIRLPTLTNETERGGPSLSFFFSLHNMIQLHPSTSRRGKPRRVFESTVAHGRSATGRDAETSLTGVLPR